MTSKQLDSILGQTPSATVTEIPTPTQTISDRKPEETVKIVARVPKSLKKEIKDYIYDNPGETESSLVLKGLKKMGFQIDAQWLLDRRTIR